MNKVKFLIFVIISVVLLFSCSHSAIDYSKLGNAPDITPIPIPEKFNFFTTDTTGDFKFYLNIPSYLKDQGCSFIRWGHLLDSTMDEIEITASKINGNSAYGYGIMFCVQPDTNSLDPMDDDGYNFLTLMINNNRQFIVGKVLNNKLVSPPIINITQSASLLEGYTRTNRINIKYIGIISGNKRFRIIFNNKTESAINFDYVQQAGEREIIINNRYGYIVDIAPKFHENFPDDPVDVRFKQIIPLDIQLIEYTPLKSRAVNNIMMFK